MYRSVQPRPHKTKYRSFYRGPQGVILNRSARTERCWSENLQFDSESTGLSSTWNIHGVIEKLFAGGFWRHHNSAGGGPEGTRTPDIQGIGPIT